MFISSTFRAMHAERDWLVKVVLLELRERLPAHRIYFTDIDLRWDVTRQQGDHDEALALLAEQGAVCRQLGYLDGLRMALGTRGMALAKAGQIEASGGRKGVP